MIVSELAISPSKTPDNPHRLPPIKATITVMASVVTGAYVS